MRPSFHPQLINDPFDDPGVFVAFDHQNRALMFDLGEIHSLSPRDILKVTHIFVTHTHMDHFSGFDRIVRLMLGRQKTLYLYGPKGFLDKVAHKLAGYTWNLVDNYNNRFEIVAFELDSRRKIEQKFSCREGFKPSKKTTEAEAPMVCVDEPAFRITAAVLDHGIACLGFRLHQRFHVNIIASQLAELGVEPGPWLQIFKQALYNELDPGTVMGNLGNVPAPVAKMELGNLASRIARISPGQVIVYIADVVFSQPNLDLMLELANGADQLFIEAAFLHADRHLAKRKYHLTAAQAGMIAGRAGVRRMTIFHHSPRYLERRQELLDEARHAYQSALDATPPMPGGSGA